MTVTAQHRISSDQRFLLGSADWGTYRRILEALGDRHVFVTYDRGRLEIMSPSPKHERVKSLLGRLVEMLCFDLDIEIQPGGSTTFGRKDLDRGLEPDECYWIRNEKRVRDLVEFDARRDPPPDLAIEIDISRRTLDRQAIYGALGVPELWRHDGDRLRILLLQPDGAYAPATKSLSFPFLPMREFERFLRPQRGLRGNALLRRFHLWARRFRKRK
ncbi:MAG: Uma2 family endonuclease [Planctomycetes bacterium]|nr:Uma2 family endonuclease [Planctomycetota bacterium]